MSWKEYQQKQLHVSKPQPKRVVRFETNAKRFAFTIKPKAVFKTALIVGGVFSALMGSAWFMSRPKWSKKVAKFKTPSEETTQWQSRFHEQLDWKVLDQGEKHVWLSGPDAQWNATLTLDEDLHDFVSKRSKQYGFDIAAVSVIKPSTGAVLVMDSFNHSAQNINFSSRATFSAASIFKVVTASAALEELGYEPYTPISFGGDVRRVSKRNLEARGKYKMSLKEAFAKSANLIFGKIGSQSLASEDLLSKAKDFGFNETIPFDIQVDPSSLKVEHEKVSKAELAAGLGDVTLTPLHGALIASAVVNEGVMMKPFVVSEVRDSAGERIYSAAPSVWKQTLSLGVAKKIESMMRATVETGTARKGFRNVKQDSILKHIEMGGKTGSITNLNPRGWLEWFVGFGKDENNQTLALSVVVLSQKFWKVKPSLFAREIFGHYFAREKKETPTLAKRNNGRKSF